MFVLFFSVIFGGGIYPFRVTFIVIKRELCEININIFSLIYLIPIYQEEKGMGEEVNRHKSVVSRMLSRSKADPIVANGWAGAENT